MFYGLLACSLLTSEAQTLRDCSGEQDPVSCAVALFAQSEQPPRELAAQIAEWKQDARSRDLLRLRLAVRDPRRAGVFCPEMETPAGHERCKQVLGRPHLQHLSVE